MTADRTAAVARRTALFGWGWSILVLGIGLWVSLATGEWIAIICAAGLVVLPLGGLALRSRRP